MTLAHFGFDRNGAVLADEDLPHSLVNEWKAQEGHQDKAFPSFARLLAKHGTVEADSEYSWTVDFVARRAKAQADRAPFLEEAKNITEQLLPLKERLKALKKAKADKDEIAAVDDAIRAKEKNLREAQAKAADIDAAVYDLKAVNPHVKAQVDTRTTAEIIENIEKQSRIVIQAMSHLRGMLSPQETS